MLGTKYKTIVSEEFPMIRSPAIHSFIPTNGQHAVKEIGFQENESQILNNT